MTDKPLEPLKGVIDNIIYCNTQNLFTVAQLNTGEELICVVGVLPGIAVGEEISLLGEWDVHTTYGHQFKAKYFERTLPNNSVAILKYLSAGAIKGVGPSLAKSLVKKFGDDTIDIIQNNPQEMAKIRGISAQKADKICADFSKQFGVREVMLHLAIHSITAEEALNIYKQLGASAVDRVKANPYLLCDDNIKFKFERVEEIAAALGIKKDGTERTEAGIKHILRHNTYNGHTCLPLQKLLTISSEFLNISGEQVQNQYQEMLKEHKLTEYISLEEKFAYINYLYNSEHFIATRIKIIKEFTFVDAIPNEEILKKIKLIEKDHNIKYEETQIKAISVAVNKGLLILTGGPGTGKTTTLNAIISILKGQNLNIELVAPTGRAAKRMGEVTGNAAKTIHRLLEVEWANGTTPTFAKNCENPLDCDVLIIDEMSMVDTQLFEHLLRALRLDCRIIMVGDSDQLPSVAAGNVLHDLISSGTLPTITLTKIFRQAMSSLIVTNAHKIISGELPDIQSKNSDCFMLNITNQQGAVELIRDLYINRLPKAYVFDIKNDLQILCPSKKRQTGTENINKYLQDSINPPNELKKEIVIKGYILREGDKVMHSRNNYNITWEKDNGEEGTGVFNGDIGILESIEHSAATLQVRFDDKIAFYSFEDAKDLELAYAITIHKSQGSEYDYVIIPVLDLPNQLKYRNLLYTGVTRAKKLLILVGSPSVISEMVHNNRRTLRYTCLSDMLNQAMKS